MNFGSGGNTDKKAWRDIWGAGQGVGQIADAPTVPELVDRLAEEYMTKPSARWRPECIAARVPCMISRMKRAGL